jgi:RNA polymerase sigma factor (sigma-70 family)
MDLDTDIGGARDRFPETRYSALVAVRSGEPEVRRRALETIIASYWKPAYKYVRIKWHATNEDAKDLVQGFFLSAIEKDYFAGYDAGRASFQTFFRTCLDRFVANHRKAGQRLKRGGGLDHLSLDFDGAAEELAQYAPPAALSPEDFFHREWMRSLLSLAVETLRRQSAENSHRIHFRIFERYDLGEGDDDRQTTYAGLAAEFGLSTTEVTNYLATSRREFRRIVLERLREITATEDEFRAEARALLGVDVK